MIIREMCHSKFKLAIFSKFNSYRKHGITRNFFQDYFSKFSVNKMPFGRYQVSCFVADVALRIFLFGVYGIFQIMPPFRRVIHPEEIWLYKNPVTDSYCPMSMLWEVVVVVPSAAIFANYVLNKDKNDVIQALLAFSLAISLNGAVTNILKVVVGRPRPDFYYRCFPSGIGNIYLKDCTGDPNIINDGLKSFPSGHSSIAFASLGFLSLYMAGKMHLFAPSGKGSTYKILAFLFPLFIATLIAISRTCDYHHHWQDVLCGSLLGFTICWLCYHNYYPPLYKDKCHIPWFNLKAKQYSDINSVKEV